MAHRGSEKSKHGTGDGAMENGGSMTHAVGSTQRIGVRAAERTIRFDESFVCMYIELSDVWRWEFTVIYLLTYF